MNKCKRKKAWNKEEGKKKEKLSWQFKHTLVMEINNAILIYWIKVTLKQYFNFLTVEISFSLFLRWCLFYGMLSLEMFNYNNNMIMLLKSLICLNIFKISLPILLYFFFYNKMNNLYSMHFFVVFTETQ